MKKCLPNSIRTAEATASIAKKGIFSFTPYFPTVSGSYYARNNLVLNFRLKVQKIKPPVNPNLAFAKFMSYSFLRPFCRIVLYHPHLKEGLHLLLLGALCSILGIGLGVHSVIGGIKYMRRNKR